MNTAIIADDEPLLRFHLKKELADAWPELEVVAEAANGIEAVDALEKHTPDIAFLDIKMPGLNGLEVAEKISQLSDSGQSGTCLIVFITAYDEFAVQAFEHAAIDYVLKPIDPKRIDKMVQRLQDKLKADTEPQDISQALALLQASLKKPEGREHLKWVKALKGEDIHLVNVNDIICFQAEDRYTKVIITDGEFLIRMAIKNLEEQLDPDQFWRVHRSTIIQVSKVVKIERGITGRLSLELMGVRFKPAVSRSYAEKFKQM